MLKRPELFTIKQFTSTKIEREVFDIYRSILNAVKIKEDRITQRNNARCCWAMIKFINSLPKYAKQTRDVFP